MKKIVANLFIVLSLIGSVQAQSQDSDIQYLKGNIQSVKRYQVSEKVPGVGGAALGGVLGGVLGHQVGSGSGKTAMTILGSVLGAGIGANATEEVKLTNMAELEVWFPVGTGFKFKFNYLDKGFEVGQLVEVAYQGDKYQINPVN